MTDVEGVRNLIGTGLIDFAGGLLTAVIAFVVLMRISPVMTAIAFGFLLVFGVFLRKAFQTIRPIFRERGKINAEVTGRLTESLGGVRVVKGYHAEAASTRSSPPASSVFCKTSSALSPPPRCWASPLPC